MAAHANLAPILVVLLMITPATSSSPDVASFLKCFLTQTGGNTSGILYSRNASSYDAVFSSSARNARLLSSSAAAARPAFIVTPTKESHVQAAVACCGASGLALRSRSGGHDYEGLSYVGSGGASRPFVVVDLANFREVAVNVSDRTAWVGAGAIVGELYYGVAQKSGALGFSAALCSTVGVGGHISGGGIGTMVRKYGLAADSVVDAVLVDARGKVLNRESMGEDLFWAIRGGSGASFGVILSYKVNLAPVPPKVTAFSVARTLRQNATKLVTRWEEIASKLDSNLFIRISAQARDNTEYAGSRTVEATFQCLYLGKSSELVALLKRSFPELGVEAKDLREFSWVESTMYFAGISKKEDLLNRMPGANYPFKGKSDFVTKPVGETGWSKIFKFLLDRRGEPVTMIMEPFGGRMDMVPEAATPFPHRKGNMYMIQYFMTWSPAEDASSQSRHLEWMRKLYTFMAPFVSKNPRGAYVNYRDIDLGRNEAGKANYTAATAWGNSYFKSNFKRLATVKAKVDPGNFFSDEQSIPPLFVKCVI